MQISYDEALRNHRWEFYKKFDSVAQKLGITELKNIVLTVASKENILKALTNGDTHLNTLLIGFWYSKDDDVRALVRQSNKRFDGWTISTSVTVLKHVSKYYIAGIIPPQEYE